MDALTALLEARRELMAKVATLDAAIKLFQPADFSNSVGFAVEPMAGVFPPAPKIVPAPKAAPKDKPKPEDAPEDTARAVRSPFCLAVRDILRDWRGCMTVEEVTALMPADTSPELVKRALYYLSHPRMRMVLRTKVDARSARSPSVFQYNPNYPRGVIDPKPEK